MILGEQQDVEQRIGPDALVPASHPVGGLGLAERGDAAEPGTARAARRDAFDPDLRRQFGG